MAVTPQTLKGNTFFTLDDVKDHLRIPLSNTDHDNRVIRLTNMVTDMMERYIDGPIKTREFVEVRDGDSSNTIVPDHYPVRSITEIRIDYSGDFSGSTSVITPEFFTIRGTTDLTVGVRGTDVAIRNDGNTSIVGTIFIGSVVGSIQITYKAGWGETADDIPEDLKYAMLMGVEYYYIMRENREINIKSKNNKDQSYTREVGLPTEVVEVLDRYKDYTLGRNNRPQKNNFST